MIEGSIKKVEGGTKIANDTDGALNSIVDGVAKVASLVGDIATASNEQASGIALINQGVMQVSQVVQTNSATSEESAAESEELSSQAQMIKEQVSRFRLKISNRSVYSYRDIQDVSHDVIKMLEVTSNSTKKIALSDKGFGNY